MLHSNEINIIILPSGISQRFSIVETGATVDGNDGSIDCPTLVPAATATNPDCSAEEFLGVCVIVVRGGLLDSQAFDAF